MMRKTSILSLLLLLARRPRLRARRSLALLPPRAKTDARDLVLFVLPQAQNLARLLPIVQRLSDSDADLAICLVGKTAPMPMPEGLRWVPLPGLSVTDWRAIIDSERPAAIVVLGEAFHPVLLSQADARDIPVIGLDISLSRADTARLRLLPRTSLEIFGAYRHLFLRDGSGMRALRHLSLPEGCLHLTGPLTDMVAPPKFIHSDREVLARGLGTRPLWAAVDLPDDEIALVLDAHDLALRRLHRLLLVIQPRHPNEIARLIDEVSARGYDIVLRSDGEDPDSETMVYIADIHEEHGLWMALAGVTYLGGTIAGPGAAHSPLEAAALGSALVHGPQSGPFDAHFQQLAANRASRQVRTASELADALDELSQPDRQAGVVQAAWDSATASAGIAEKLLAALMGVLK